MSDVLNHHSDDSDPLEHRSNTAPPPRRTSPWPWIVLTIVLLPVLALVVFAVVTFGGVMQAWQTVDNIFAGRLVVRALLVTMGFRQVEFLPANAVADTGCPEY